MDDLLARERARFLASHTIQAITAYEIVHRRSNGEAAAKLWTSLHNGVPAARYSRLGRPIEWFNKPRSTSGARKICRFSVTEAMFHRLAADLIVAQHVPRPHIGDWPNRGRDHQMMQLVAAMQSAEQAVVIADVRRCFASVNIAAIYELPYVPEDLIRGALDHRTRSFVRIEKSGYAHLLLGMANRILEAAPSGLMEGSPASNAIFGVLMDDLPDHLDDDIVAFVYCDNVVLIAPNIERALSAEGSLVRYFTDHRAGPFELEIKVQSVREPFEHLGYEIVWMSDAPSVGLAWRNWIKLIEQLDNDSSDLEEAWQWLRSAFRLIGPEAQQEYEQSILDELLFRLTQQPGGPAYSLSDAVEVPN